MPTQDAQRQNIRTTDGHTGATRSLPDERVLLTLDDRRSIIIDADRLQPQADGTYVVALTPADG
jgi:hypothetical protein